MMHTAMLSGIMIAGSGIVSFPIKSRAEAAFDEYRAWKAKKDITAVPSGSWRIVPVPQKGKVSVSFHIAY
ncbi:MAG: hypothetical protein JW881_03390 [Spirochaetales bacterium]|nr:hypothetical protein [Spirochaetales bacterium]